MTAQRSHRHIFGIHDAEWFDNAVFTFGTEGEEVSLNVVHDFLKIGLSWFAYMHKFR
jgi:hypothetical protein